MIVGVIVATIVLLPETAAAIRAAARRQLQASINLALGSAVASIGLSVPVVAIASFWIGQPLELGISAGATVLMALGFVVAIITYGTGRTNLLSGIVHLMLLATYVFTVFAPLQRAEISHSSTNISVPASFVWRCLSGPTVTPFPHPAHRTGRADFPHPALGQDFTPSPTTGCARAQSGVRARSAHKGARMDRPRPCVAGLCA